MRDNPKPQEIYRHFKGRLYQIVTLAESMETGETLVVYQALYGDFKVYARELSEFLSETDRKKYPSAGQRFRFEKEGEQEAEGKKHLTVQGSEANPAALPPMQAERPAAEHRESDEDTDTADAGSLQTAGSIKASEEIPESETIDIDPLVLEFLDADSYEERLNILAALHSRITDEMINTMAVAVDVEVNEGEIEERYNALKNCLLTFEKYECNRLR